ncbi:hypothetical protein TNCV_3073571 [Trichonephila clavipes]|nr:hypothetical protein TNCV_3073571 [Trichonephila clavipes]
MPSPGFEPRPYDKPVSVANHYTGGASLVSNSVENTGSYLSCDGHEFSLLKRNIYRIGRVVMVANSWLALSSH